MGDIINPFKKYGERQLLIAGLLLTLTGSIIGYIFRVTFDGIIDIHPYQNQQLLLVFFENLLNVILCFVLLFIAGKIVNIKTRAVDILNAAMLYRAPFYLMAALVDIPVIKKINNEILKNIQKKDFSNLKTGNFNVSPVDSLVILVFSVVTLALLVYGIVLLVNGFKVAANAKKWQHWLLFAIALIVAEIISKNLITHLIA